MPKPLCDRYKTPVVLNPTAPTASPVAKYQKSILSQEDSRRLAQELVALLRKEKLYLEENLSLAALAEKLGTHPKQLSQVINENFQQNFFGLINSYRIEAAKARLRSVEYRQEKIYEIMYSVGFNSRSSFNAAFKKATGYTAKQYREIHLEKN